MRLSLIDTGELELIQSPSKVDHIRINYATAAKNVDVKALKRLFHV